MPSFRERPVTWLFVLATVVLTLLALTAEEASPPIWGLSCGEALAGAAYAVAGSGHRLFRGAVGVVSLLVAAALVSFRPALDGDFWNFEIVFLTSLQLCALLGAAIAQVMRRVTRGPAKDFLAPRLSVSELLGWSLLVAVVSAATRRTSFATIAELWDWWVEIRFAFHALALLAGVLLSLACDVAASRIGKTTLGVVLLPTCFLALLFLHFLTTTLDDSDVLFALLASAGYCVVFGCCLVLDKPPLGAVTISGQEPTKSPS